jgi:hypothetical protein
MVAVAATSQRVDLPPYYYRDNFQRLCDTVERQYGDLLDADEAAFLQRYHGLSFEAQCLYVRLVSRVGPWFRSSRLAYPELGDTAPIIEELERVSMLRVAATLSTRELGALYTREELTVALGARLDPPVAGKTALLEAIDYLGLEGGEVQRLLVDRDQGKVVMPLGGDVVAILQLLFFGNRRQSLTEFVLSDLGVTRYFPYGLDRDQRLFRTRRALEEYLACASLSDRWYELRDKPDPTALLELAGELSRLTVEFDSSRTRWDRLCNSVARELERQGEAATALSLYESSHRHPSRERRARILEGSGELEATRVLCERIIEEPWCEGERDAAARILSRVVRKLDGTPQPRPRDDFDEVRLQLPRARACVELAAAEALSPAWQSVEYVENRLMNALFGLAFWNQIFAAVPGAFHNPFQSIPGDMYEQGFLDRRRDALAARRAELATLDLRRELGQAYQRCLGYQCRWVDWRYLDADLLDRALCVLPTAHLLAIWDRILFDPRENRRGFPDLIALGRAEGDYCLIEVKGPGDALQHGQRRWLRFFAERGIPARIAWVTWSDD